MATDYRDIAAIAKQRRADALSKEPLLSDEILKAAPQNVTHLSRDLSIFSQDEIEIINSEAEDILLKIRERIWTSLEVTEAFCKSAVYAQQLVWCLCSCASLVRVDCVLIDLADQLFDGNNVYSSENPGEAA